MKRPSPTAKARAASDKVAEAASRRLAQIRLTLCPEVPANASASELAQGLGRRMECADAAGQRELMVRAALAVSDIRDLVNSLDKQLRQTREELRRLNGHTRAALAYAGAAGLSKMGKAR